MPCNQDPYRQQEHDDADAGRRKTGHVQQYEFENKKGGEKI